MFNVTLEKYDNMWKISRELTAQTSYYVLLSQVCSVQLQSHVVAILRPCNNLI